MSTRKRLESLTSDLIARPAASTPPGDADATDDSHAVPEAPLADAPVETRFPPALAGGRVTRTAPGHMLTFRAEMLEVEGELARLRERLAHHEGSLPTRKIDADLIEPSRWANRHPASFLSPAFTRLKADIEHAGGNVQPVLVRPREGAPDRYELIFGHRRHRACQDLKLPVLAAIWTEPLSDAALFAFMERENRERANLSPYEQGRTYQRALEDQLYPSLRRLAEALGVSHTWVRKALEVAQLPQALVECFVSPLEIQHRHAEALTAAMERDRRGVLRRAERLRGQRLPASQVVAQLAESTPRAEATRRKLRRGDTAVGAITQDARGTTITLTAEALSPERLTRLLEQIEQLVGESTPTEL
jgi:ParB family chromosome partitioning protein